MVYLQSTMKTSKEEGKLFPSYQRLALLEGRNFEERELSLSLKEEVQWRRRRCFCKEREVSFSSKKEEKVDGNKCYP